MGKNKQVGDHGERLASAWLSQKGYEEVERNARMRGAEMDLIMRRGQEWLFVEVKTRRLGNASSAPEDVHPRQVYRLGRFIESYVTRRQIEDWRLLLVCVVLEPTRTRIYSIELTESLDVG